MTQRELKEKLQTLVGSYFGRATILWSRSGAVTATCPFISLWMGDIIRPYQPITKWVNGVSINCYALKTSIQIDLFTKGEKRPADENRYASWENTALDDMSDFVNFLNSVNVSHWCINNDVSILVSQVRDLTELTNDTSWDYRAMVELEISFSQTAVGNNGIMWENGIAYDENGAPLLTQPEFKPTPSGGRTKTGMGITELADESAGWFENVDGPQHEQKEV